VLGLQLVVYLTYVAAIGTATVRAIDRAPNRVLTGMLAWSGIFGLGAASYYVGRSHSDSLISTFSPWALTLALLTVHCAARVAASPLRRAGIAAFAVFVGIGVAACSLAQTPTPWEQLQRLTSHALPEMDISVTPLKPDPATRGFYATVPYGPRDFYEKRGAPMVIMITGGHRIADAFGVVNVSPFSGIGSVLTVNQMAEEIAALRAAGGNTVIMPAAVNAMYLMLASAGFEVVTASGLRPYAGESLPPEGRGELPSDTLTAPWMYTTATKWVDTHNLYPRFLRHGRGAPVVRIG
jgi:hypothetical protein